MTLQPSAQRLVAFVAIARVVGRSELTETLWPRSAPASREGNLRCALHRLRSAVPEDLLVVGRSEIALAPFVGTDLDDLGDCARDEGDGAAGPVAIEKCSRELLPAWYDDWVSLERERIRVLQVATLEAHSAALREAGRFAEAIDAALAATEADPFRDSAHEAVIRAHLAEGNHSEATRHFVRYATALQAELGVAPSARLSAVARRGEVDG